MAAVTVVKGKKFTLPKCAFTAPEGKEFDKWAQGDPGDEITVTADRVITAVWKDTPQEEEPQESEEPREGEEPKETEEPQESEEPREGEEPKDGGESQEKVNPFLDVSEGSVYYDAVLWAYYAEPQVTNGIDSTHFGPENTVTRGQAVTFLWRAMGCPEPTTTENPFVDVTESKYFYKPVLWAMENGITNGTDKTHFTPNQTCSTAHIITFLYRTITGRGNEGWYQVAESWSLGAGLMGELEITVAPGVDCPRGSVVYFLHRALVKE